MEISFSFSTDGWQAVSGERQVWACGGPGAGSGQEPGATGGKPVRETWPSSGSGSKDKGCVQGMFWK